MKFFFQKGNENEIRAMIDEHGELMFLVILTDSQVDYIKDDKTVLIREKKPSKIVIERS